MFHKKKRMIYSVADASGFGSLHQTPFGVKRFMMWGKSCRVEELSLSRSIMFLFRPVFVQERGLRAGCTDITFRRNPRERCFTSAEKQSEWEEKSWSWSAGNLFRQQHIWVESPQGENKQSKSKHKQGLLEWTLWTSTITWRGPKRTQAGWQMWKLFIHLNSTSDPIYWDRGMWTPYFTNMWWT